MVQHWLNGEAAPAEAPPQAGKADQGGSAVEEIADPEAKPGEPKIALTVAAPVCSARPAEPGEAMVSAVRPVAPDCAQQSPSMASDDGARDVIVAAEPVKTNSAAGKPGEAARIAASSGIARVAPESSERSAGVGDKASQPAEANSALVAPASAGPSETPPVKEAVPLPGGKPQRRVSGGSSEKVAGKASGKAAPSGTEKKLAPTTVQHGGEAQQVVVQLPFSATAVPAIAGSQTAHAVSAGIPTGTPPSREGLSRVAASVLSVAPGGRPVLAAERVTDHRSAATVERQNAIPAAPGAIAALVQRASSSALAPLSAEPGAMHGRQQAAIADVPMPAIARASAAQHAGGTSPGGAAFDRIDSGAAPQVLSRTPQRLDVGVRDPGLGWVEIRAHAAEGQIAATVSAEAHPALAAQLPAMREFLAGQQVRVDTLNAQPFEAGAEGGRHGAEHRNPSGNAEGAARAALPEISDVAEAESLSWIDVRV
jgi:hypothetical protein